MVRGYSTNSLLIEPWVRIAGGGVDEHELFLSATAFGVGDNGVAEGAGDDGRRHSWVWSGDVVRGSTVSATVASLQGADGRASSRRAAADTSSMSRSTSLRPISTRRRIIKGVRAWNHRVTETYTIEHSGSGSYRRDGDRRGWRAKSFFVDNASFVALDDDAVSILSVGSGRDVVDAVSCGVRVVVRDARARDCEALVRLRFSHRRASALRRAFRTRACPPSSLVLHVAEDCNMRCGYCYADFGRYGGEARLMTACAGRSSTHSSMASMRRACTSRSSVASRCSTCRRSVRTHTQPASREDARSLRSHDEWDLLSDELAGSFARKASR